MKELISYSEGHCSYYCIAFFINDIVDYIGDDLALKNL